MSEEKMEIGIDPATKEAINKEGFEGDTEGGAAVIIGKKEGGEIDQLRERVESEGQCADAATYVKLNKKIILPAEEVPDVTRTQKGKGWIGSTTFRFVDKDGNIAEVNIDYAKIASMPTSGDWGMRRDCFADELKERGFDIENGFDGSYARTQISERLQERQRDVEKQTKDQREKEFDF